MKKNEILKLINFKLNIIIILALVSLVMFSGDNNSKEEVKKKIETVINFKEEPKEDAIVLDVPDDFNLYEGVTKKYIDLHYEMNIRNIPFLIQNRRFSDYRSAIVGYGSKEVDIYINPECPYCKQMLNRIASNEKRILEEFTINFILVPFPSFSNRELRDILYTNNNKERVQKIFKVNTKTEVEYKNLTFEVDKEFKFLEEKSKYDNINSIPTVKGIHKREFLSYLR